MDHKTRHTPAKTKKYYLIRNNTPLRNIGPQKVEALMM